jgi:putative intracellular protease/amidase
MYSRGDIISAVCHGGAIFPGIIDKETGRSIIAGKEVTGFTTQGEIEEGILDTIKSWTRPTIEATAGSAGATCNIKLQLIASVRNANVGQTSRLRVPGMLLLILTEGL